MQRKTEDLLLSALSEAFYYAHSFHSAWQTWSTIMEAFISV